MSELREWASALCVLAIGCSLLSMLSPPGRMRRVSGVLTAVLFLCCLLSPLSTLYGMIGQVFDVSRTASVSTELSDEVDAQAERVLNDTLYADACERLETIATVKSVAITRDSSRADSIYIERVRVTLDKEDRTAGAVARKTLEQAWGIPVEVYYVG